MAVSSIVEEEQKRIFSGIRGLEMGGVGRDLKCIESQTTSEWDSLRLFSKSDCKDGCPLSIVS